MKFELFLLGLVLSVAASFSGRLYGATHPMEPLICHTPRVNLALKVEHNNILFIRESVDAARGLASTEVQNVRTLYRSGSITKVLQYNGDRYTIHIGDQATFSNLDNYMIVRNDEGHEMTYPLSCEIL